MASAVATLAGRGGDGVIGNLREGFGLDDLDVTTTDSGATAVRAGKYISDNVYTDVTAASDGTADVSINLDLTDNVALAACGQALHRPLVALLHRDRAEVRKRARDLLELVGIGGAAESLPDNLPLGYLKRLEVARALALNPKLLLLDEPLAGLNQSEAKGMADLIASLAQPGRAILLIEHNLREVARICPRLYVQDGGRSLIDGPTEMVMASRELRQAYLGASDA